MYYDVIGNVLWDVMYWWSACLHHGISYNMLCFIERHLTGSHVLLEGMYYRRACFVVGDVLLGYMVYRWAYLTG